jgi:hypothetical protein
MVTIAKALLKAMPATSSDGNILKTVAVFCGIGLGVSLLLASYGADLNAGFF